MKVTATTNSGAKTLGALRSSGYRSESVKDEMRRNLRRKLAAGEALFPGVLGYDDSVVPQVVNAILSRHNFILLGLRGQAKSRLLRSLTNLLDASVPVIAGCEIHDDPLAPLCRPCRDRVAERGDATEVSWLGRDQRFVEKLATPDATIADIIGDVDPIRAARGGHDLGSELTMHYGLLPRAHRGIFALNELPDLAARIQVGLFNILQEGDVQIKGYPVRLPIDVVMAFTANPEDYTARGKIITPLKDRIGSEVRTHYAGTLEQGVAITQQEAWTNREVELRVPRQIREVVEGVAFAARREKKIDKRSGVSQRLPISALENVVSNAERRALVHNETPVVPRVSDIYAAAPALTGKFELEYEGELVGAEAVARDLIRQAIGEVFSVYMGAADLRPVIAHFEQGSSLKLEADLPSAELLRRFSAVPGLLQRISFLGASEADPAPVSAAAAEFILEGLCAQKKIGRSDERGFQATERPVEMEIDVERLEQLRRMKKQVN